MALPQGVIEFLNESAERAGAERPQPGDDLFKAGVLDSFGLIDFVSVLEQHCGIQVPDADVNPATFRSVQAIEQYVAAHQN